MGKAQIIADFGEGLYRVRPVYDTARAQAEIAGLEEEIAELEPKITELETAILVEWS